MFWLNPPFWLQIVGVVGPLIAALIVFLVDKRIGRGYGLTLFTLAAGAVAVGATLTIHDIQRASIGREGLGPSVLMIFVLFYQLAWAIMVSMVGLGLAAVARQWGWFIGIGVGLLIMLSTLSLSRPTDLFGPLGSLTLLLVLCAPLYACLAYGLRRIFHPREWPVKQVGA